MRLAIVGAARTPPLEAKSARRLPLSPASANQVRSAGAKRLAQTGVPMKIRSYVSGFLPRLRRSAIVRNI